MNLQNSKIVWSNIFRNSYLNHLLIVLHYKASYTLIAKHAQMGAKNEKCKEGYFASLFSHFALFFRFLQYFTPGSAFAQKLEGFCGLFFRGINKTQNSPEMWKCIVSVSYFVVCFAKTFVKYTRNTKYEKCIADLMYYSCRRTKKRIKDCEPSEQKICWYDPFTSVLVPFWSLNGPVWFSTYCNPVEGSNFYFVRNYANLKRRLGIFLPTVWYFSKTTNSELFRNL